MNITIPVGTTIYRKKQLDVTIRHTTSMMFIAKPRTGKGSLAKHCCVYESMKRPIFIFDRKGEWKNHITAPNYEIENDYAMCIPGIHTYTDFTFKISDFSQRQDLLALRFDYDSISFLEMVLQSRFHHQDNIERIISMINELPTKKEELPVFNRKYGTRLQVVIHVLTRDSMGRRLEQIKDWFWQGPQDKRKFYNFGEEWLKHDHCIVDFGEDDEKDPYRYKAFVGKMLTQLKKVYQRKKGAIYFEEASLLFPEVSIESTDIPRSNREGRDLVTIYPKLGTAGRFIFQHPDQFDNHILTHSTSVKFIGKLEKQSAMYSHLNHVIMNLKFSNTGKFISEFIYYGLDDRYVVFNPVIPCCEYKSDL